MPAALPTRTKPSDEAGGGRTGFRAPPPGPARASSSGARPGGRQRLQWRGQAAGQRPAGAGQEPGPGTGGPRSPPWCPRPAPHPRPQPRGPPPAATAAAGSGSALTFSSSSAAGSSSGSPCSGPLGAGGALRNRRARLFPMAPRPPGAGAAPRVRHGAAAARHSPAPPGPAAQRHPPGPGAGRRAQLFVQRVYFIHLYLQNIQQVQSTDGQRDDRRGTDDFSCHR